MLNVCHPINNVVINLLNKLSSSFKCAKPQQGYQFITMIYCYIFMSVDNHKHVIIKTLHCTVEGMEQQCHHHYYY